MIDVQLYTILSSISNDTDLLLYNFQEILYNPSIVWEIVPGFLQYRLAKTSTAAAVASSVARSLLSNGGQKWISVKFVHTVDHLKKNFLKKFLLEHLTPLLFFRYFQGLTKVFWLAFWTILRDSDITKCIWRKGHFSEWLFPFECAIKISVFAQRETFSNWELEKKEEGIFVTFISIHTKPWASESLLVETVEIKR